MREGWTYKKLGDCLSYIKNGANIKQTKGAIGIPITRIETLSGGVFNRDRLGYADIFSAEKYSQNILDDGDILMSHINSKAYIGRSVLYKKEDDEQIIHGMNLLRLKVIPSILLPSFLNTSFQSVSFRDEVAKIRKDAVNQSSMAISDLVKIPIPIPPLSEQQRIVSELDLLSGIIEKKKAQLKEYDQLAQSIFYDMFGDLLDAIPTTTLKDVASYLIGLTYKPSDVSESGTVVLRSSNIQNNILDFNDIVRVNLNIGDSKIVKDGDILMCARNGSARLVGKVARIKNIEEKMSFGAFMTIIRSKYNDFLFHFFLSDFFRRQLTTSKTATINQITSKMLDNIKLNVPPLSLQQSFAEKIEAIERQKALIQQSITEVETLFNSRMDYYFN